MGFLDVRRYGIGISLVPDLARVLVYPFVGPMDLPEKSPQDARLLCYAELAPLADESLMGKLREGHYDALAVLCDRYHRLVLNVALRILRDAGEAEDLMQSVFLEIFRAAAQFDPAKGTTKVWLLQYAYHRSFNRRQYLNLRGLYESPDESGQAEQSVAATPSGSLTVLESARLVQQALGRLNKLQRRTLELAIYEGLTMREIAERTGESFVSVRHHYYRGLDKLRLILCAASDSSSKRSSSGEGVAHVQP
jgi:RNA polymerase sigma-70 factor (ECF subfamily)